MASCEMLRASKPPGLYNGPASPGARRNSYQSTSSILSRNATRLATPHLARKIFARLYGSQDAVSGIRI